jgi:hypothetical protein
MCISEESGNLKELLTSAENYFDKAGMDTTGFITGYQKDLIKSLGSKAHDQAIHIMSESNITSETILNNFAIIKNRLNIYKNIIQLLDTMKFNENGSKDKLLTSIKQLRGEMDEITVPLRAFDSLKNYKEIFETYVKDFQTHLQNNEINDALKLLNNFKTMNKEILFIVTQTRKQTDIRNLFQTLLLKFLTYIITSEENPGNIYEAYLNSVNNNAQFEALGSPSSQQAISSYAIELYKSFDQEKLLSPEVIKKKLITAMVEERLNLMPLASSICEFDEALKISVTTQIKELKVSDWVELNNILENLKSCVDKEQTIRDEDLRGYYLVKYIFEIYDLVIKKLIPFELLQSDLEPQLTVIIEETDILRTKLIFYKENIVQNKFKLYMPNEEDLEKYVDKIRSSFQNGRAAFVTGFFFQNINIIVKFAKDFNDSQASFIGWCENLKTFRIKFKEIINALGNLEISVYKYKDNINTDIIYELKSIIEYRITLSNFIDQVQKFPTDRNLNELNINPNNIALGKNYFSTELQVVFPKLVNLEPTINNINFFLKMLMLNTSIALCIIN